MHRTPLLLALLALSLPLLSACEGGGEGGGGIAAGPVSINVDEPPRERLSSYRFFDWVLEDGSFAYNDRVAPYDLNTPLFSDYAVKDRAIYVPEGQSGSYDAEGVFDFPVGSVILKTFSFPADFREPGRDRRLIETRVLIHTSSGWEAWPYLWNEAQTDAELAVSGDLRELTFIDAQGESQTANYLVPQRNQCRSCHERYEAEGSRATHITPIGPAARHLNRDYDYGEGGVRNQLEYLTELGLLSGVPALSEVERSFDFGPIEAGGLDGLPPEDLEHAARSYLDTNCAHCHDPMGPQGVTSQLFLDYRATDVFHLGVCKRPGSAGAGTGGLTYDIVPGAPDESILVFRVETTEVGAMMPLLGRSLEHQRGAELLRAWVGAMEPMDCSLAAP